MHGRSQTARTLVAIASVCAWLAVTPDAYATITSVFKQTATPVPCAQQANLVRLCDEHAFTPPRARSTVRTYDGVPIDVRVAFPQQPATGPDGPFPLIVLFPRFTGEKLTKQDTSGWQGRGYATLTMTNRGFGESCGTQASRAAEPSRCAVGFVRMMDTHYEVRDAQELIGRLVEDGVVDPLRIGAVGSSYGGAQAFALAALKDRKILRDNSIVSWKSPNGTRISLAAAAPATTWTDLMSALAPNGSTLDYVADAPYQGRTGVLKQSVENALYDSGLPFFYEPNDDDFSADLAGWHTLLNAGEPYEHSNGDLYSAVKDLREEMPNHSSYYIDHSKSPAPLFITSGWTDDLAPADEAIRFYNRTRTQYPDTPISLFLASLGHARAQRKQADVVEMNEREAAWMDFYVKGVGNPPFQGIETIPQTCPDSVPSGGPYFASDWAAAAPGEVRLDGGPTTERISPSAGSSTVSQAFDPLSGLGACATAPALDQAGAATYRSAAVPAGGFTLMGSPTVIADITSTGRNSQIAARLLDVDPQSGVETLIARGLWRPVITSGAVRQVFQMHPNAYWFAPGHVVKLELLPNDSPSYGRVSNGQAEVRLTNLQLRLPALEQPGSLDGLVQSPAAKFVPAGYTLARDFISTVYPRPRGATPVHLALVPAFRQCTSPNGSHGGPLAFGSCKPPVQTSQALTFGTPDLNGKDARSVGSADFEVVAEDPLTPANEADVGIAVSLADVRAAGTLDDYTGELESRTSVRITDRANGGSANEAGTVVDTPLHATLACTPTAIPNEGSTCAVLTSANALIPGAVRSGRRSVWALGTAEVYDGGADSDTATTSDNKLLARQGLFAR